MAAFGKLSKAILGIPYYGGYLDPNPDEYKDDPYASVSSLHVGSVSASGAASGLAAGSRTTEFGAGADGHFNAAKLFQFESGYDRFTLGAYGDFRSDHITYDSALGTAHRDRYAMGGTFAYLANDTYLHGKLGALWGTGDVANGDGSTGRFDSSGYEVQLDVGHVYTLFDKRLYSSQRLPTKAPPPRQLAGGYTVNLDVGATFAAYHDRIGQFTDTSGFVNGAENISTEAVGAHAKLSTNVFNDGRTWTPYVAFAVNQQIGFNHTLEVIAQPGVSGGIIAFGAPGRTYVTSQTGLNLQDSTGINYGIDGAYISSSGTHALTGRAYVRFPIARWLGTAG